MGVIRRREEVLAGGGAVEAGEFEAARRLAEFESHLPVGEEHTIPAGDHVNLVGVGAEELRRGILRPDGSPGGEEGQAKQGGKMRHAGRQPVRSGGDAAEHDGDQGTLHFRWG